MRRWSNSSLFTLQQCGEKWRRRYIENDWRPFGINAARGKSVHRVAKTTHRRQLSTKTDGETYGDPVLLQQAIPSLEEAQDVCAAAFTVEMQEEIAWTEDQKKEGIDKVKGQAKDMAIAMAGHYVQKIAPIIDPIACEHEVIVHPKGTEAELKGIMDLVAYAAPEPVLLGENIPPPRPIVGVIPPPRPIVVVDDLKTSARTPYKDAADRSQQLTFYAMLRRVQSGFMPDRVRLKTIVETPKTKKVKHVLQTSSRSMDQVKSLVNRINIAIETVKAGVFVPANPDQWYCSSTYCEYFNDCRFAIRPESVSVTEEVQLGQATEEGVEEVPAVPKDAPLDAGE